MLTILWDNDGVLVDTEGLYFQACREVLGSVGVDLTLDQFQEISLRRGESVLVLAAGRGIDQDGIARCFPRQACRSRVDLPAASLQLGAYQLHGRPSEGVGVDHIAAGLDIPPVQLDDTGRVFKVPPDRRAPALEAH